MNGIERGGMAESALAGIMLGVGDSMRWRCKARIELFHGDINQLDYLLGRVQPFRIIEHEGNLLTGAGVANLMSGLVTSGLATPYTTANAQIVVGDGSTTATTADTDMGAVVGTKLNAADPGSASNATPIVIAATYSPTPVTGQVVVTSGFTGAGGSAANGTFEITAASASTLTLLNSAGTGSITVTGALVKPINKYAQAISSVTANPAVGGAVTAATNATPIVITTTTPHGLSDGMIIKGASMVGNTGGNTTCYAKVTGYSTTTFGMYADKALTVGIAGNGAWSSGGTINLIGGFQMAATFATINANFAWNEWGIRTGGAVTNLQATPPPTLLNHAINTLLTKTSAASAVFTATLTIS